MDLGVIGLHWETPGRGAHWHKRAQCAMGKSHRMGWPEADPALAQGQEGQHIPSPGAWPGQKGP